MNIELNNTLRVLDEYCEAFNAQYRANLERDGRVASRNLIETFTTNITVDNEVINVTLNVADYYWYVEHGRNKGKRPPINKIVQWIEDKNLPIENENNLPRDKAVLRAAFAIANGINGDNEEEKPTYEGKPSLEDAITNINQLYQEKIRIALNKDIEEYELKLLGEIEKMLQF